MKIDKSVSRFGGKFEDYVTLQDVDFESIYRHFSNSKIETIKNAGHWLHAENPKDFYDAVMRFLQ